MVSNDSKISSTPPKLLGDSKPKGREPTSSVIPSSLKPTPPPTAEQDLKERKIGGVCTGLKKICSSIAAIFKSIWNCLKSITSCCDDVWADDDMDLEDEDFEYVPEVRNPGKPPTLPPAKPPKPPEDYFKNFDPLIMFYDPATISGTRLPPGSFRPNSAKPKDTAVVVVDPMVRDTKRNNLRSRQIAESAALAEGLSKKIKDDAPLLIHGQKNLGNTCHMNAVMQVIEGACRRDQNCMELLKSPLTKRTAQTLEELERDLLHQWSPIKESDFETQTLQRINKELAESISALAKSPTDFQLKEKIASHRQELRRREDRILFKWSYLLVLQAKRFGSKDDIVKALRNHHAITFNIERNADLKQEEMFEQHDANEYFTLWHDMMGIVFEMAQKKTGGATSSLPNTQLSYMRSPYSILSLSKVDEKKPSYRFLDMISGFCDENSLEQKSEPWKVTRPDGGEEQFTDFNTSVRFVQPPPPAIHFQFKRFEFNIHILRGVKIDQPLDLQLMPEASTGKQSQELRRMPLHNLFDPCLKKDEANYELTGFVVHLGEFGGGHYIAYVKNESGKWFLCNDDTITPVAFKDVPFRSAYFLTFQHCPPADSTK